MSILSNHSKKILRRILLTLVIFTAVSLFSAVKKAKPLSDPCELYGTVYFESNRALADYTVYIEGSEGFADITVYKEESDLYADRPGHWYIASDPAFANFTLFIESDNSFADFNIYFTDIEAFAGCH